MGARHLGLSHLGARKRILDTKKNFSFNLLMKNQYNWAYFGEGSGLTHHLPYRGRNIFSLRIPYFIRYLSIAAIPPKCKQLGPGVEE